MPALKTIQIDEFVIGYEDQVSIKRGVRPRTGHVNSNNELSYSEALEGSETIVTVPFRTYAGNTQDFTTLFNRGSSLVYREFIDGDAGNPNTTTVAVGGYLKELPTEKDQDIAEYEFVFPPIIS